MASWNVAHIRKREYELLNGSSTSVRCSPKSNPDISWLMSRMEELGVPAGYTRELEEIYFTRLHGDAGDYFDGRIRISVDSKTWDIADKVLVHELGHHVDDMEDVTSDESLAHEKKTRGCYMPDGYARKNVGEYLACGFEIYYCGSKQDKRNLKKKNPVLYATIRRLHRRFSRL